jgi:hypothetical protein
MLKHENCKIKLDKNEVKMDKAELTQKFFTAVGEALPLPPEVQQKRTEQVYATYCGHMEEFRALTNLIRSVSRIDNPSGQKSGKGFIANWSDGALEQAEIEVFSGLTRRFLRVYTERFDGDPHSHIGIEQTLQLDKDTPDLSQKITLKTGRREITDSSDTIETLEQATTEIAKWMVWKNPEAMQKVLQNSSQLEPGPLTDRFLAVLSEEFPHAQQSKMQLEQAREAAMAKAYETYVADTEELEAFAGDLAVIIGAVNEINGEGKTIWYQSNPIWCRLDHTSREQGAVFAEPTQNSVSVTAYSKRGDQMNCIITQAHEPNADKTRLTRKITVTTNDGRLPDWQLEPPTTVETLEEAAGELAKWLTKDNPELMRQAMAKNAQAATPQAPAPL